MKTTLTDRAFFKVAPELIDVARAVASIDDAWLKTLAPLGRKALRDLRDQARAVLDKIEDSAR
jgi:hypothetical protein